MFIISEYLSGQQFHAMNVSVCQWMNSAIQAITCIVLSFNHYVCNSYRFLKMPMWVKKAHVYFNTVADLNQRFENAM